MCIRKYNCLNTFGHLTFSCKGPIVGGLKQWHEIQSILSCAAPGVWMDSKSFSNKSQSNGFVLRNPEWLGGGCLWDSFAHMSFLDTSGLCNTETTSSHTMAHYSWNLIKSLLHVAPVSGFLTWFPKFQSGYFYPFLFGFWPLLEKSLQWVQQKK